MRHINVYHLLLFFFCPNRLIFKPCWLGPTTPQLFGKIPLFSPTSPPPPLPCVAICNAWEQDLSGWAVSPGNWSGYVTINTLFCTLLSKMGLSKCPIWSCMVGSDHILQIALVTNKHSTIFILKVLEGCGWGSIALREKKKLWVSWVWH